MFFSESKSEFIRFMVSSQLSTADTDELFYP